MIQHFLQYIEHERRLSPLTIKAYSNDLDNFSHFLQQQTGTPFDPQLVTPQDIRAWIIWLMENGYHARNINRKLSALRSLWRYGMKMQLVTTNPTSKVIAPKYKAKLPTYFRDSEVEQAINSLDDTTDFLQVRNALIIDLLYQTGIRQAELLTLTLAHIQLTQNGGEIKVLGKRNKERIVPFGQELSQRITLYINMRNQIAQAQPTDNLLIKPNGKPVTKGDIYKTVHNTISPFTTQQKVSPHVLRHTFATTLLNHGADINAVKTLLGHADLNATQVYTHTTLEEKLQSYRTAHPRANNENNDEK